MNLQEEIEKINKMINNSNIICQNCGHSWVIEKEDENPHLCHKCAYDNKKDSFDIVNFNKFWDKQ